MRRITVALALVLTWAATNPCLAADNSSDAPVNPTLATSMTETQAMEASRAPYINKHPGELHLELRQDLNSLLPPTPSEVGGTQLPGVKGEIMAPTPKKKEAKRGILSNLGIVTVGGPGQLGKCATNEWSGLQITNPAAVPGQVQGFNIGHF